MSREREDDKTSEGSGDVTINDPGGDRESEETEDPRTVVED